jgi:hypothetical protein
LVIGYSYLWRHEYHTGEEEGRKNRPCAIVLVNEHSNDETMVMVVPITHSMPNDLEIAIEIPATTKARLGLDGERSWVVVNEVNRFIWSESPDLRPISRSNPTRFDYGVLPPKFYMQLKTTLNTLWNQKRLSVTPRF